MLFEILRRGRGATGEPFEIGATGVRGVTNVFVDLYAARVDGGVVLFDTGMDPHGRPVDRLLAELCAERSDVTDVFLTHGHPDHVAAAPLFPDARVHAGADDLPRLTKLARPPRAAERWFRRLLPTPAVHPTDLYEPEAGPTEVTVDGGTETVLVLPLPGDTPGASAFLFREVLFVGDALDLRGGRLQPAFSYATDDAAQNLRSIASLPERLAGRHYEYVCTAHGGPTPPGQARALLESAAALARASESAGEAASA